MATTTQIANTLRLKTTFGIGVPVPPNDYTNYATIDDISDWSSILNPGETIKTLYHFLTQVNTTVYKSAGFDTADFSNPEYPTNNPLAQKQLPLAANGQPVEGVYKVIVKIQFDDGATPIVVEKTWYAQPLCLADAPTVCLSPTYSCRDKTFTSTDATDYGNAKYTLISTSWAHTVYPPQISGQSSVTVDSPTNVLNNLWKNIQYEIKNIVTVTYKREDTYFIFVVTGTGKLDVYCDDALCVLYCLLKKVRDEYYAFMGKNPTKEVEYAQRYALGTSEFFMAVKADDCGYDKSVHVRKFYEVTKMDPNCDCGCGDSTGSNGKPGPVTGSPGSGGTDGADGTNGLTPQFRVTNPGNILQWKYTTEDDSQWRNLIDLSTLPALGAFSGYNYELALLVNPDPAGGFLPKASTAAAKAGDEALFSTSVDLQTGLIKCNENGSRARFKAVFTFPTAKNTYGKYCYLYIAGQQVGYFIDSTVGLPAPTITIEIEFYRLTATTAGRTVTITKSNEAPKTEYQGFSFNWGTAKTVVCAARIMDNNTADNEVVLNQITLEKFKPLI